jgi:hypothetical protein
MREGVISFTKKASKAPGAPEDFTFCITEVSASYNAP